MPEMDGLVAAWMIRQTENPCESCKVRGRVFHRDGPVAQTRCFLDCSPGQACCRVPIWAVSACSDQDQISSPVVHHLEGIYHEGEPFLKCCMEKVPAKVS